MAMFSEKFIHELTIIEGLPVVIFSNQERDEDTLLSTGKTEMFWYTKDKTGFRGGMEVYEPTQDPNEVLELLLKQAKETLKK